MILADFLCELLNAHAGALAELDREMGREALLSALNRGEPEPTPLPEAVTRALTPLTDRSAAQPYAALETSFAHVGLPQELQDRVWTCPQYRRYAESAHDLNAPIDPAAMPTLIDDTLQATRAWSNDLGLPALPISAAWARFRAQVMRRCGRSPLAAV